MICLDTNVVIAAIARLPGPRIRLEDAIAAGTTVGVPAIVLFEMWCGIRKSDWPQANEAALATFLEMGVSPWPFEPEDAEEAGDIRAVLERAGTPIGPYDILIAAQARRRDALLVTANEREFARVPELRTESWEAA